MDIGGRPRGEHIAFREHNCSKRHFRCELRNAYQTYARDKQLTGKRFDIDQKKLSTFLNRNNKSKSYSTNLVVNGKKCISQDDILDGWAEHFETFFKMETYYENQMSEKERNIRETVIEISEVFKGTSLENRNYNIDVTDIEKVLKNLKKNKATGFDNIAYEHLTYGGNCFKWHMMNLFNLVSANYYTPKPCKSSLIVPFLKEEASARTI